MEFKFAFCVIKFSFGGIKFAFDEIKFSFGGIKFAFGGIKFASGEIKFAFGGIKFAFGGIQVCIERIKLLKTLVSSIVHGMKRLLRTFAPKSSYGEIFFISPLELGHKVLTPKMEKKWGSPTLFRRKWQGKNALISINRS